MTILLVALLVLILFGGGIGYRNEYWGYGSPVGLVLLVLLVVVLFSLFAGPRWGFW